MRLYEVVLSVSLLTASFIMLMSTCETRDKPEVAAEDSTTRIVESLAAEYKIGDAHRRDLVKGALLFHLGKLPKDRLKKWSDLYVELGGEDEIE